jgi:hypothetical protein
VRLEGIGTIPNSDPLSLGYIQGITSVFPLRESAFHDFVSTNMSATELVSSHIVPEEEFVPRSQAFLYIGGVIHLPSLASETPRAGDALPLIRQLIHHIGDFIPPIRRSAEDHYILEGSYPMPKLTCILDGRIENKTLAEHLGFEPTGTTDAEGDSKYHLDLADVNNLDVSRERRLRIMRGISLLQHYCN